MKKVPRKSTKRTEVSLQPTGKWKAGVLANQNARLSKAMLQTIVSMLGSLVKSFLVRFETSSRSLTEIEMSFLYGFLLKLSKLQITTDGFAHKYSSWYFNLQCVRITSD